MNTDHSPLARAGHTAGIGLLLALASPAACAIQSTETWSGGDNNENNWSANGNWTSAGGAGVDDDLVFPSNALRKTTGFNDFPVNTNFSSLTFSGGGYAIGGNQIFLGASGSNGLTRLTASVPSGSFVFTPNIILGANQTFSSTGAAPYTLNGVVNLNAHTLILTGSGPAVLNGLINGTGSLLKNGSGSVALNGTSTGFGTTQINQGTLEVGGALGTVVLVSGTLSGDGSVGNVTLAGLNPKRYAPGTAAGTTGILTTGSLQFSIQTTLEIDLNGNAPGSQYDRMATASVFNYSGASLDVSLGFVPAVGDQFVILTKSGSTVGTFAQGGSLTVDGVPFSIGYQPDSVVLTVQQSVRTWSGGSNLTSNWADPANWTGGVAPLAGDRLVFPENAARKVNTNNFAAADSVFDTLTLSGAGYVMGGNAITLLGGISEAASAGVRPQLNLGLTLAQAQAFNSSGLGLVLTGPLNLNGSALQFTCAGAQVNVVGAISGAGGISKSGTGTLNLAGGNSYTGLTQLNSGALQVQNNTALGATGAGNHTVVANGAFMLLGQDGVNLAEAVTLNGSGTAGGGALQAGSCAATGCTVSGALTLASASTVGTAAPGVRLTISSPIGQTGGARPLTVTGPGTTRLTAANTYSGTTSVNGGRLLVEGVVGVTTVAATGTLGGSGTTGAISGLSSGGTVAPGASAGTLSAAGNVVLLPQNTLSVELGGTAAGTFDRLDVTGSVDLGGAVLQGALIGGFIPALGDTFTVVQSTTGISGQFAQGASTSFGGVPFSITYLGNSVVLTVTAAARPDLTVAKSHTGAFARGQTGATYAVTVTNSGAAEKPAASLVTLLEAPPSGLTVTAMSGDGWNCAALPSCTRSDALAPFQSYPPLMVTVTVADDAVSPQVNSVTVSTAASESDTGNNTDTDATAISGSDLTIAKSHAGDFVPGQGGAYSVVVTNAGPGAKPAGAAVSVTDSAPSGLDITAMSGSGWSCAALPACTRTDLLGASQSYPPITVTVTVAPDASSPQVNSVAVTTTAPESNTGNNSADDATTILLPDLMLAKSHAGSFVQGGSGSYAMSVSNAGGSDKLAGVPVTVTDTAPAGLSVTAMSGAGWDCATLPACSRADLLAAGQAYPPITVSVAVAGSAESPLVNTAAVATNAVESDAGNNGAADSTVIVALDAVFADGFE
jgi:autotransporter-associated beta strand protein